MLKKIEGESAKTCRVLVNKILQTRLADPKGNSFSRILSIREYNEEFSNGIYTAKVEYQRQYCYVDVKGSNGHPWQRELMASLITFQSLDYIWINEVEMLFDGQTRAAALEKHIIDGGQRSRTIRAWFTNCIRLPKGLVYTHNGQKLELGGKNWSDVKSFYPEFSEFWLDNYHLDFKVFNNYTNDQCSVIFNKLNDVNSMSKPEFRNSIWSDMATFVRGLSDFENKDGISLKMVTGRQIEKVKGTFRGIRHSIGFKKRGFDDFVTKISYLTINPLTSTGNKVLEEWYRLERKGKGQFKKFKKKIKENLKWVNDLVLSEKDDTPRNQLLGANDLQFLFHIKTYLEKSFEFKITNHYELINFWRRTRSILASDGRKKAEHKQFIFKDYNGEIHPFSVCFKSLSSGRDEEIEEWASTLGDYFEEEYREYQSNPDENLEVGFKLLDKSRSIKKDVKEQVLVDQEFKCEYYDWCGNTVTMSSPGDHSETSHTDGGSSSDVDNCDMTCEDCNSEKGTIPKKYYQLIVNQMIKDRDTK